MDNPLTLQEAKDQVAKKYGYNSFIEFASRKVKLHSYNAFWEVTNEAAELYARSKEKEGFDAGFKKGLLEGKSNVKSCPNCLSEDVIMFTADLDICNRCNQTF